MRNLFLLAGMSVLLAGCLTDRDLPGLKSKFAAAEAARPLVTPALVNDCASRVAKEVTYAKVSGPFVLSAKTAGYFNDIEELGPVDNIVALVAPTINDRAVGGEMTGQAGCSYRLQNGALVLRKVYGPTAWVRVIVY